MLSREQAIAEIDFRRRQVKPDRLTRQAHAEYPEHAREMIQIYRDGVGRTRQDLHRDIEKVFRDQPDCPIRRIGAFCKLLDNLGTYDQGFSGDASRLRRSVFRAAARHHPLVSEPEGLFASCRESVRDQIASELGRPWNEIEQDLFADVIEFHRLAVFPESLSPTELLSRYNVAQTQVALYDAISMTVWSESDFSSILKAAKLAGLMHGIVRQEDGVYCFRFDGPASLHRETRRYGTALAKFLPSLIACRQWKMIATIKLRKHDSAFSLTLSDEDGLSSHVMPPEEFDSKVEANLAQRWGIHPREGWSLHRESCILHEQQHVFTPDFSLIHQSGLTVPVEIVGFWTPEYLTAKLKTLERFSNQPMILMVPETSTKRMEVLTESDAIRLKTYKTAIRAESLLEAAESLRLKSA